MKKFLVLTALVLLAFSANAQVLQTSYYFEADFFPTGAVASYEIGNTYVDIDGVTHHFVNPSITKFDGSFRFAFNVEFLLWEKFFIGGRLGTVFTLASDYIYGLEGSPSFMDSLFVIGFRYKWFEVGMQRFCNHPVLPNAYGKFISSLDSEVSWGKFYLKVGGKL